MNEANLISFIDNNYSSVSDEEKAFLMNVSLGSPEKINEIMDKKIYDFYQSLLEDLISSKSFLNFKDNNIFLINSKEQESLKNFLNIVINDLIKKSLFFLIEDKYPEFTLDKEKKFIQQIIQKNNHSNLFDLYFMINKNMSAAETLNLNKSDILIDSFKDLCGI